MDYIFIEFNCFLLLLQLSVCNLHDNFSAFARVRGRCFTLYRAVPRSLEVGGQDIGNGEKQCAKHAN